MRRHDPGHVLVHLEQLVDDHDDHGAVNPYEVLGLGPGASLDEARRAYVALARRHHPDRWADAPAGDRERALRRMQEVNEAWNAISSGTAAVPRTDEARPFRPFDTSDDDPDPRAAPDVPYRPARPPSAARAAVTIAPAVFFAASAACALLGMLLGATALWTFAVILFVMSCLGFVAVPLLALGSAARDE